MEKGRSFPEYSCGFDVDDGSKSYSFNGPAGKGSGFSTSGDPELKRKRRISGYNVFIKEGKVKSSVKNSFKWIKSKFSDPSYGHL